MDTYKSSFAILIAGNIVLGYVQYRNNKVATKTTGKPNLKHDIDNEKKQPASSVADRDAVQDFQKCFFLVYIFVVASDWLQGPYMYSLYRDEKGFSERSTAILFACGFVSAAISASYAGKIADQYGRKQACLSFCVASTIGCMTLMSNSIPILIFGRMLGGLSSTLLYSVFEAWMVHEYHAREMNAKGLNLGTMFGTMTTVSSMVAILAGVIGEGVVDWTRSKIAPFKVALICLAIAFLLISNLWTENFGDRNCAKEKSTDEDEDETNITIILKDERIVALSFVCCLFEGTMYLFVFFWSAALKYARFETLGDSSLPPPFGLIFATFMSAMMFGSQFFSIYSNKQSSTTSTFTTIKSAETLSMVLLFAAVSLLVIVNGARSETIALWSFCIFEACVGLYYPSMGCLKGNLVDDGARARVYGLLRIPLNLFVVITLALTQEGNKFRGGVFLGCGGLLILGFMTVQRYLL